MTLSLKYNESNEIEKNMPLCDNIYNSNCVFKNYFKATYCEYLSQTWKNGKT